jgi:hypothetical protein
LDLVWNVARGSVHCDLPQRLKFKVNLMGIADHFERKLPELETHLEGLVAEGETDEDRLTVSGLSFLKGNCSRRSCAA